MPNQEYKVIESAAGNEGVGSFEHKIDTALKEGWRCQGGVTVAIYRSWKVDGGEINRWWYAQAMVRDLPIDKKE